ncbi:ABC transporter substrate-binding protein [Bacillus sp. FJAT-50079]|uniref:ABC transporter substrate-binding protein n=1 Tax=Bacillus sp. FJAT-50079 TaxID=2833577 RepID=UPI001BCA18F6|nr:ABC transporter substrate-binding protein [Bacillus sp. FJAT-50079]MBS4210388.1 ABC transporter substrate-binding protein [Bacillus sp. FJAT-50079]
MFKRTNQFAALVMLFCFILLISGCSSDAKNNTDQNNNNMPGDSTSGKVSEMEDAGKSPYPRKIDTANGEITIEEEPEKVAIVHWGYLDSLLLFDLKSIAAALPFTEKQSVLSTESYKPYVDKLDELVIVGENEQVNLEALLDYDPDLIIAGNSINKDITTKLSQISTTIVIDEEETNVWGDWPSLVRKFGEILAQEDVAENYISEFNLRMETAKEKLANLEGTVAFLQVRENMVWLQGVDYLKQYYEGLGLKTPDADTMKEGAQLSLEGLTELNPDHLFLGYFNYGDQSIPAITDEWEKGEVWKRLKSVQNDHVYPINGELALGFGPIGHSYGVQAVLEALE